MGRSQIVDLTYNAAKAINDIRFKHNIIDKNSYEEIRRRIDLTEYITKKIDEIIAKGDKLEEFKKHVGEEYGILCSREELRSVPIAKVKWVRGGLKLMLRYLHIV
jgi:hypothetical protein